MTLAEITEKLPEMLKVNSPDQQFNVRVEADLSVVVSPVGDDLPIEFCSEEETEQIFSDPAIAKAAKEAIAAHQEGESIPLKTFVADFEAKHGILH